MKKTYYSGEFKSMDDVVSNFETDIEDNIHVHLAHYDVDGYDGSAFVLIENTDTGKLYEIHGSHCSCNGLEGQWEPEEVCPTILYHRYKGTHNSDEYAKTVLRIIAKKIKNDPELYGKLVMIIMSDVPVDLDSDLL